MGEITTERRQVGQQTFAMGMFAIAAAYWREISEPQITVFYQHLGDRMTDAEWTAVVNAVNESRDERAFPPTPGQLLGVLEGIREEARLTNEAEARALALRNWLPRA